MNIVLTGSSSGIGRELAKRLLLRGHRLWGIARSDQSDFAAVHGESLRTSCCDVSDWVGLRRLADEVDQVWPHIDALITCAGVHGEIGPALGADPIRWSDTVRINLDGAYFAARAFAPALRRASRRAKIICFSGGGATKSRVNFSAYGVAKTAIVRLVETIAEEEAKNSIDINAVAPGAINTRLTDEILSLGPAKVGASEYASAQKLKNADASSLGRALGLVEWLLSSDSDGISGRLLSAPWDPWDKLSQRRETLATSDIYTLRRIVPSERGQNFG